MINTKTHTYHIMKCINKEDHKYLNLNEFVTFEKYVIDQLDLESSSIFDTIRILF